MHIADLIPTVIATVFVKSLSVLDDIDNAVNGNGLQAHQNTSQGYENEVAGNDDA